MKAKIAERIFLCGFMGAGKSSVGKRLAHLLNYSFYDLDEVIEQKVGLSVKQMFDKKGEIFFRKTERQSALNFLPQSEVVVALGGGSLQDVALTEQLKNEALLVFIECPISVILKRITGNKKRPLLLDENGDKKEPEILKNELNTLYESRLPLYRKANIVIDSSLFSTASEAADNLYQQIEEYGISN